MIQNHTIRFNGCGCGEQSANYKRTLARKHPQTTETQLKQTTKTKVATFKFFPNFFSALYEFWNVYIVFAYVLFDVMYFSFYFILHWLRVVKCKQ